MLAYSNAVPLTLFRSFAIAARSAGRCGDCDVLRFCQLGFPHSLRSSLRSSPFVSSFFSSLLLFYTFSSCHAYRMALGRGDAWLSRCVRYGMVWPCGRYRGDGQSDDAMRVTERAVRGEGRNEGRDGGRAVFVSSIWSFPCCHRPAWGSRGVLGLLHRGIR